MQAESASPGFSRWDIDVAEFSARRRARCPERGTAEFEEEVAEGRRKEDAALEQREAFAAQVRGVEPAAGVEDFMQTKSIRAQIIAWIGECFTKGCSSCKHLASIR